MAEGKAAKVIESSPSCAPSDNGAREEDLSIVTCASCGRTISKEEYFDGPEWRPVGLLKHNEEGDVITETTGIVIGFDYAPSELVEIEDSFEVCSTACLLKWLADFLNGKAVTGLFVEMVG